MGDQEVPKWPSQIDIMAYRKRKYAPLQKLSHQVLSVIKTENSMALDWLVVTCLSAPSARVSLRFIVLEWLSTHGVWHNLDDMEPPGAISAALLLAGLLTGEEREIHLHKLLESFARLKLSSTAGDAMLLCIMFEKETLQQFVGYGYDEVIQLALWQVEPESFMSMPESDVAVAWFECQAFRGVRRSMARRQGRDAGKEQHLQPPKWLLPSSDECVIPAGAAVMVGEYGLACLHSWLSVHNRLQNELNEKYFSRGKDEFIRVMLRSPNYENLMMWFDREFDRIRDKDFYELESRSGNADAI